MRKCAAALVASILVGCGLNTSARAQESISSSVAEYVDSAAPVVVLRGTLVVDGTGAEPLPDHSIVIRDGRIAEVGPTGDISVPADAEVVDLAGHTVIPGIVGTHNHTFYTTSLRSVQLNYSSPRLYLGSGVTTIRTTGSMSPYSELNLRKSINDGRIPGPRMHVTGPYISGEGAGGGMHQVATAEDARRVVGYWADEGATWFKFCTLISRDAMRAAIDEAHRRGVKLTGHLCSVGYREAVALGIDNLEHGLFANSEYDPNKEPDRCPRTMTQSLRQLDIGSDA